MSSHHSQKPPVSQSDPSRPTRRPDKQSVMSSKPPFDEELSGTSSEANSGNRESLVQSEAIVQEPSHGFDDWQTVDFPNALRIDQILGVDANARDEGMSESIDNFDGAVTLDALDLQREHELLDLIGELNECNDLLLAKVAHLEDALDHAQGALQSELDRSQRTGQPGEISGTRPSDRQIAQLVCELDDSTQTLKHHKAINETLQRDFLAAQDRASHLENECIRLQQKYADQSQKLMQSDNTVRDLRSRLQRQQRYTLQFKAALEKCLNVSNPVVATSHAQTLANFVLSHEAAGGNASTVLMPKAQDIQPWSTAKGVSKLDPQLENLIRGFKSPSAPAAASSPQSAPAQSTSPLPAPLPANEADTQLWQDLARVMEEAKVTPAPTAMPVPTAMPAPTAMPVPAAMPAAAVDRTPVSPWVNNPFSTPLAGTANSDASQDGEMVSVESVEVSAVERAITGMTADGMMAEDLQAGLYTIVGPAPVVYPLRPQKRVGSLAAVDLPSFPKLPKVSNG
jgi:hypothetical protein